MDIRTFVHGMVIASIGDSVFDQSKVFDGIDMYIDDNGFVELNGSFDDAVIKNVIKNNLSDILRATAEETILFFSNYTLIENIRVLNNKTLELAQESGDMGSEIADVEMRLNRLLKEIYRNEGLSGMLKSQISEILLNLDYAKKVSPYQSRRLRDMRENQ